MSASFGLRDNNELSWSQVVDHVASMAEATSIPVLLDGDTGYGNFNSMRRLVRKLEQVGAAGVTIEDKLFPKTNSFLRGELQALADVDEFCGKIKAGKDSQADPDFVLVARVEALIAGWGLAEALRRAEAYHAAGADAILIHSRQSSPAEIFAFLAEWGAAVPGRPRADQVLAHAHRGFPGPPGERGHLGQSSAAVRHHGHADDGPPSPRRRHPCSTSSPRSRRCTRSSASRATTSWWPPSGATCRPPEDPRCRRSCSRPGPARALPDSPPQVPKAMLKVQGRPILPRLLDDFAHFGCRSAVIVRGHRAEAIDVPGAHYVDNADWATTGEAWSLALAEEHLASGHARGLRRHRAEAPHPAGSRSRRRAAGITLAVDSTLAGADEPDRVIADRPDAGRFSFEGRTSDASATAFSRRRVTGCGSAFSISVRTAAAWLREAIAEARADGTLAGAGSATSWPGSWHAGDRSAIVYSRGGWVNVNDLADLLDASGL